MASFGNLKSTIYEKEERKQQYQAHIRGLNAYDRHKKFLNDYAFVCRILFVQQKLDDEQSLLLRKEVGYSRPYISFMHRANICLVNFYGKDSSKNLKLPVKTDKDTLREGYRFIRSEEDDMDTSWEQRLVKRYYDKLFKEYCIADMSHYKTGKIGLRWRTEKEVMSGKGQFICGNKHCEQKDQLASYEVNFSYFEAGENKQALVKLVACERCAEKLNYKKRKDKERLEKQEKEESKRKREQANVDNESDYERSKEKRKRGKKASVSADDRKVDGDENFDEYLEGMFP